MPSATAEQSQEVAPVNQRELRRQAILARRSGKVVRITRNDTLPEQADVDDESTVDEDPADKAARLSAERKRYLASVQEVEAALREPIFSDRGPRRGRTSRRGRSGDQALTRCMENARRRARRTR